jgi:hypothetical protein
MATVKLGETVRDAISGLEGVSTGRFEYLFGCTRIMVQPRDHKDGKPAEGAVIDEQQLVVLDRPNILETTPRTNLPGGDRAPPLRPAPPAR